MPQASPHDKAECISYTRHVAIAHTPKPAETSGPAKTDTTCMKAIPNSLEAQSQAPAMRNTTRHVPFNKRCCFRVKLLPRLSGCNQLGQHLIVVFQHLQRSVQSQASSTGYISIWQLSLTGLECPLQHLLYKPQPCIRHSLFGSQPSSAWALKPCCE